MTDQATDDRSGVQSSRDELINEIIDRYISGQSIRAVAQAINRSYGLVQGVLKEAGVALRSPGSARGPVPPPELSVIRDAAMAAHPSTGIDYAHRHTPDQTGRRKTRVSHKPKLADEEFVVLANFKQDGLAGTVIKKAESGRKSMSKKADKKACPCGCEKSKSQKDKPKDKPKKDAKPKKSKKSKGDSKKAKKK